MPRSPDLCYARQVRQYTIRFYEASTASFALVSRTRQGIPPPYPIYPLGLASLHLPSSGLLALRIAAKYPETDGSRAARKIGR